MIFMKAQFTKLALLIFLTTTLTGCYKQIAGTLMSSHDLTGKIYSHAQIEIVNEEELKKHLISKMNEDKSEIIGKLESSIQRQFEYLEKQQINVLKMSQLLGMASNATGIYGNSWQEKQRFEMDKNKLEQEVYKSVNASNEWVKQIEDTKKSIREDQKRLENLRNGKDGVFYFSDKIGGSIEKADSEGKFKFGYFSNEKKYILIRGVNKFWCLKLNGDENHLYLSDADVVDVNNSKNSCPNIKELYN